MSPMASQTFWISSKLHSGPSNSGRRLPLRLGSFFAVATPSPSSRHAARRKQLVEHGKDILRCRHSPHGKYLAPAQDLLVALPHGCLYAVIVAFAVGGFDVGKILADGQNFLVEELQAARHV